MKKTRGLFVSALVSPFSCGPTAAKERDPPLARSKQMHANEGVDGVGSGESGGGGREG